MALPPKGDPQRPLALAVRSTRFLGILFLGLGMCGTVPLFLGGLRGVGRPGGPPPMAGMGFVAVGTVLMYFGPGALYLVCSIFIARRRTWAVITAMVLAGVHIFFMTLGLAALAFAYFAAAAPTRTAIVWIPAGVVALVILALAQLEYHLSKCFEAIRRAPLDVQRGFEPMAVATPVAPLPPPKQQVPTPTPPPTYPPMPPPAPPDDPARGGPHGPTA